MPRNRKSRPRASLGTGQQSAQRKKPGACVRLDWNDADHPWWLTLEEAQAFLAELTTAVREAERNAIKKRGPQPPVAGAAALPNAA